MIRFRFLFLGLAFILTASSAGRADSVTFGGYLTGDGTASGTPDANVIFSSTLNLATTSDVLIETYSAGGLIDSQGNVIDPGGGAFQPEIAIAASGVNPQLLADSSSEGVGPSTPQVSACPPASLDGNGACVDTALEILGLSPGSYVFYVTGNGNLPNVDATNDLTGFGGGGSFFGPDGFGDPHITGEVIVTPEVSSVPEPGTLVLIGTGFLALASGKLRMGADAAKFNR